MFYKEHKVECVYPTVIWSDLGAPHFIFYQQCLLWILKKQNAEKPNYPTGPVQFDAPPQMAYPGPHHYQNPFPEYPPVQENHIILDDDGLKTALAVQIEYYFSDANLQKGEQHLGSIWE